MWHNMTKGTVTSTSSALPEFRSFMHHRRSDFDKLKSAFGEIERISIIRYTREHKRQCRSTPPDRTKVSYLQRFSHQLTSSIAPSLVLCGASTQNSFTHVFLIIKQQNVSRNLAWSPSKYLSLSLWGSMWQKKLKSSRSSLECILEQDTVFM